MSKSSDRPTVEYRRDCAEVVNKMANLRFLLVAVAIGAAVGYDRPSSAVGRSVAAKDTPAPRPWSQTEAC